MLLLERTREFDNRNDFFGRAFVAYMLPVFTVRARRVGPFSRRGVSTHMRQLSAEIQGTVIIPSRAGGFVQ
jgi:hypothetical protein